MDTVYFVSYYVHNKDNDGWAYKVDNKYTTLDAAKKQYHTNLSSFIDSPVYDNVAVLLTDSYGNTLMHEWWSNYVAPEPPEPNEDTEE